MGDEDLVHRQEVYGIETKGNGPEINIGKLFQKDLVFVDSKVNKGVQVTDLLVSGLRQLLRQEFANKA